jgi:hypothetical protein
VTTCDRDTTWLLEASLEELRGETDSEHAEHLRDCEQCAGLARHIVARTSDLAAVMDAKPPEVDVDAILARARLVAEPGDAAPSVHRPKPWRQWVTLAAAASVVGVLLMRQPDGALPGVEFVPRAPAFPTVETAVGHDVAIIETDNPDITVLWFY